MRKIKKQYINTNIVDFLKQIADPYRWLEDPDSEETKAFIEAENKITRPFLDSCPVKTDINNRLTELWNYPKYSSPFRRGDRYFFFKNTGLQNQKYVYIYSLFSCFFIL